MAKDDPAVDLSLIDAVRLIEELYTRKVPLETIEALYGSLDDYTSGKYEDML